MQAITNRTALHSYNTEYTKTDATAAKQRRDLLNQSNE